MQLRAQVAQVNDRWLTIKAAAGRVERSEATIYRWARDGHLHILARRVRERELVDVDKAMRDRIGRPRKPVSHLPANMQKPR